MPDERADVLVIEVAVAIEVVDAEGGEHLHFALGLGGECVEEIKQLVEVQIARAVGGEHLAEARRERVVVELGQITDLVRVRVRVRVKVRVGVGVRVRVRVSVSEAGRGCLLVRLPGGTVHTMT